MPSSTRQATPGPSSTVTGSRDCPVSTSNTKKRAGSEDVEDARHSKKIKVDGEPLSNLSMNAKGKKKKKKKKKKRTPVVVPEVEPKERVKPKSRTQSNKPASVGKLETITNGPVDDTKHMAHGDGKPPHILSNKGKGKARSNSPTSQFPTPTVDSEVAVAPGSEDLKVVLPDSVDHASEIARLKEQLALQDTILQRHKVHLAQHQQAVTCQICLDLLHRPFALAPCGHTTCYNCLIRWFTALPNPNAAGAADDNANPLPENVDEVQLIVNSTEAKRGTYLRRRKTCPVCRATVLLRPVEMWAIKSMVVTLVNSKLVDLPVPPNSTIPGGANNNDDANNDPWRNIFHRTNAWQGPLVQNQADHEHMGMYDNEDGGIYRCIDCFHEIWGGVCSGCNRGYPGHEGDDDDPEDDLDFYEQDLLGNQTPPDLVDDIEVEAIPFWNEENGNFVYPMLGHLFMSGDEGMTDSEEGDDIIFDPFQPNFLGPLAFDEGSDEEHESDYGGSFIDDNEEGEGENMDDGLVEVIELNDASSDEEHCRPPRLPQARTQQRRRALVTSEDERSITDSDDDEANDIPAIPPRRTGTGSRNRNRRHVAYLLTDGSRSSGEEHDDDEEEELAAEEVLSRSRTRPRWVSSDEE